MTYEELNGLKDSFSGHVITLDYEICGTCKNYNLNSGRCRWLEMETSGVDFICDGYNRKRSGQYRRKRAKYNKR